MSQTVLDISQSPSQQLNIVDNAGFEIWQRANSFSTPANGAYTADRWTVNYTGSPTFVLSKDTSVFDSGTASLKIVTSVVGGSTQLYVKHLVESYASYAGKTLTFSIRVKAPAAGVIVAQLNDGVSGTQSAANVGTGWETLTVSINVAASPTQLAILVGFITSSPTVSTLNVDSAALVIGTNAATFVPLSPTIDLARCQRYYEIGTVVQSTSILRPVGGGGNQCWNFTTFQVAKRVVPTVTVTPVSVVVSNVGGQTGSDSADTGNWTFPIDSTYVGGVSIKPNRASDSGFPAALFSYTWTASADL